MNIWGVTQPRIGTWTPEDQFLSRLGHLTNLSLRGIILSLISKNKNPKYNYIYIYKTKKPKIICMMKLSFFTNLLISRWAGHFPPDDGLGLSQTSRGKSQPVILIVNLFVLLFFSDELVNHQMSWLLPMSWLRGWHTILSSSNDKINLSSTV